MYVLRSRKHENYFAADRVTLGWLSDTRVTRVNTAGRAHAITYTPSAYTRANVRKNRSEGGGRGIDLSARGIAMRTVGTRRRKTFPSPPDSLPHPFARIERAQRPPTVVRYAYRTRDLSLTRRPLINSTHS